MSIKKYIEKNKFPLIQHSTNMEAFIQHHFYGVELTQRQQESYERYLDILALHEKGYADSFIVKKIADGEEGKYPAISLQNARRHMLEAISLFGEKAEIDKKIKRQLAIERYKYYAQLAQEEAEKTWITREKAWEIRLKCFEQIDKLEQLFIEEEQGLPANIFDPRNTIIIPTTDREALRAMYENIEDIEYEENDDNGE